MQLHNLIHQLFLFSMPEAFFILSSFITKNTSDAQIFLWFRCIPHTEYGKSTAKGEGDVTRYNQGYFIQVNGDRQCPYNVILRRLPATIFTMENQ
jgi:hypothetical protein